MSSFDKVVKLACKPKAAPPKAKYIDPIIAATWSDDGAVHDVCKALSPRIREPNAIVAFKALIVLHTMIRNGSTDNVLSYLSSSEVLRLRNMTAGNWDGYAAPQNLQNYALYLDSRIRAYKDLKHDAVRVQADTNRDMRNSQSIEEDGYRTKKDRTKASSSAPARSKTIMGRKLRSMTVEKGLLRETKAVHNMIDALVECRFYLDDLEDELTITALRMLVKDLLILFQAGNEGVINVLENYFEMSHIDAEEALRIYRHFCKQTDYVVEYLGVAKKLQNLLNVSIPNLKHAPVSLAGALEEYLRDPNFEQNRLEYKANKEAADGKSRTNTNGKQPSTSTTNGNAASTSSKVSFASGSKTDDKKSTSDGNKDIIDFFSAIEPEQPAQSVNAAFGQQAPNPFAQMPTGQPFMQQAPQISFQPTGFIVPQQTAMPQQPNPFGNFLSPQVQVPQQTGHRPFSSYLQPQATGFAQPPLQQPQQTDFLQPQATGVNPFRQSMLVPQTTGMALFANTAPHSPHNQAQSNQMQSNPMNQNWMSGSTSNPTPGSSAFSSSTSAAPSPFAAPTPSFMANFNASGTPARPASTPLASSTNSNASTLQPVKTHQTGTNNPFGPITIPAPPVPKPPTLFQLQQSITGLPNSGVNQPQSNQQPQGQQQQSAQAQLAQPTGFNNFSFNNSSLNPGATDISSVASSFAFTNSSKSKPNFDNVTPTASNGTPLTSQDTSTTATGSTFSGSLFSSSLSTQPTGTTNTSFSTQSSTSPVKSHLTGFSGLKPFKPSSSFGASLLESLPPIPGSGSTTPAITGLPSTSGLSSPGNALSSTSSPSPNQPNFAPANQTDAGKPSSTYNFLSSQPTGTTGGFGGSSLGVGLRPQITGGGGANPFRASMAAGQALGPSSNIPPLPSMNFRSSQPFGVGMFGNQQQQQPQQNSLI